MLFAVIHITGRFFERRIKFFRNKAEAINYMINRYCMITGDDKKSVLNDVECQGYRHFRDSYVIGTRIIHIGGKYKLQLVQFL